MSPLLRRFLAVLRQHARGGVCALPQADIALTLGASVHTVRRLTADARRAGAIEVMRSRAGNRYRLVDQRGESDPWERVPPLGGTTLSQGPLSPPPWRQCPPKRPPLHPGIHARMNPRTHPRGGHPARLRVALRAPVDIRPVPPLTPCMKTGP